MALSSIEVTDLTKRYGRHRALAKVSFTAKRGSLCALLGANGAGKSTLLGILSTLVRPTSGGVTYLDGDRPVAPGGELRRDIGVLAHEAFVYGGLTARENLQFYAKLFDVDRARIEVLLDEVGLATEARDRPAGEFSRGMLQRLALARALLADPSVLLLDEPFTGLDRAGAASLSDTMGKAKADGRLVIVVTHDLESIGGICDHVLLLSGGHLAHEARSEAGFDYGQLRDLYHEHAA